MAKPMSIPVGVKRFYLAGLVLAASFMPLLFLPGLRGPGPSPVFLLCFSLAGAAYLVGILQLWRSPIPSGVLWGTAVLARLVLLGTMISLSDDVYRYLWDGHLLLQGINPYALPVSSPALDAFATPLRQLVNHPGMASPYLPAAQAYFWLLQGIAPQQVKAFQAAAMLLDLLTGVLIQFLLVRLRLNPGAVLVYLWNPLLMVEFAGSAHVDALMLFLGMAGWAFILAGKKWHWVSAPLLALATLIKGTPCFMAFSGCAVGHCRLSPELAIIAAALVGFAGEGGWGLQQTMHAAAACGVLSASMPATGSLIRPAFPPCRQPAGFESGNCQPGRQGDLRLADGVHIGCHNAQSLEAGSGWSGQPVGQPAPCCVYPCCQPGLTCCSRRPSIPGMSHLLLPPLPFFIPGADDPPRLWRWMVPWVYFSLVVVLSYLAYPPWGYGQVPGWVLWVEYLPSDVGLAWAYISTRTAVAG